MTLETFIEYCWSFYGPRQICGEIFGHTLDRGELEAACKERMKHPAYEGDSVDREAVRDELIRARKEYIARRKQGIKT